MYVYKRKVDSASPHYCLNCKKMWGNQEPRILVQVTLFVTFFFLFGLPAVERFLKKDVMIVETMKDTKKIPVPAITFASSHQIAHEICFQRNVSFEDCIGEETLERKHILKSTAHLGFVNQREINLTQDFVKEDFTSIYSGRYYTLSLPLEIGPQARDDQLFIPLNKNLTYHVMIHDPKYFMFSQNPTSFPTLIEKFTTKEASSWFYRLEMTEVNRLNLPYRPCNEDIQYSFQSCVRRNVASKVTSEAQKV